MRLKGLPKVLRQELSLSRRQHGWTQAELGQRLTLPQAHISGIETGKIVPRFDTLLDIVRVLDYDLVLLPRTLIPAVQAMIRNEKRESTSDSDEGERSLYADTDDKEPE